MNKAFLILYIPLFLLTSGCNEPSVKFPDVRNEKPNIKVDTLMLSAILCEPIDASYVGSLYWANDSLLFLDTKFCALFIFDNNGKFIGQHLSQGPGPDELPTKNLTGYCHLRNGKHYLIGPSNDAYVFGTDFHKENFHLITRGNPVSENRYDDSFFYTLSYPKLIIRDYEDKIYMNVYCEHPDLHMFNSYSKYVSYAHYLAEINSSTGLMDKVFGNYTPPYKKENTKQFTFVNYDIDRLGNFYISLEADSLIYCYDNSFNPLLSFGYEGKYMDKSYMTLSSIREFRKESVSQRETHSYYTWLEYIDEREILFRSYQKDMKQLSDGLQIYEKNTLIGDLNVPKGFKVIGYSDPYFIGAIPVDEDNERITFYKFKL